MNKSRATPLKTETSKCVATTTKKVAEFAEPDDFEESMARADLGLKPGVNAAAVVAAYSKTVGIREADVGAVAVKLSNSIEALWAGDTKRAEAMLYAQAHALQAIFTSLSFRATRQDYMKNWEAYLRMAFKAQNQCRMTLETLAAVKNPPAVFARQANINNGGQQQVNNGGTQAGTHARPAAAANPGNDGGFQSSYHALAGSALAHGALATTAPTELLEKNDGQRMDPRAAGTAGRADPHMEAMGAVNWAA